MTWVAGTQYGGDKYRVPAAGVNLASRTTLWKFCTYLSPCGHSIIHWEIVIVTNYMVFRNLQHPTLFLSFRKCEELKMKMPCSGGWYKAPQMQTPWFCVTWNQTSPQHLMNIHDTIHSIFQSGKLFRCEASALCCHTGGECVLSFCLLLMIHWRWLCTENFTRWFGKILFLIVQWTSLATLNPKLTRSLGKCKISRDDSEQWSGRL